MIPTPAPFRAFACLLAVGSLFSTLPKAASAQEGIRKAPNLIVIMTDDQGYADAGFNGCKDIPTPNMDRLAAGGAVCTSANASNNTPLRGAKSDPCEGGFRAPFAVRWPGTIPAGIRFTEPVSSLDIFATIAAVNQIPASAERPLAGVNLLPYLRGEKSGAPHDRIYLRMFDSGAYAMREGDFKIVNPKKATAPALYNLANDISERTDLSAAQPERLEKMRGTFDQWTAQLVEPAFPGLDMREWQQPQHAAAAAD